MNVAELVVRSSVTYADRIAVVDEPRSLTYRELEARTNRVAHALAARGLEPGERVAVLVGNRAEWFDLTFGLLKAGLVRVYVNPRLAPPEISYMLRDSQAAAFIVSDEYRPLLDAVDLADVRVLVSSDADYDDLIGDGPDHPVCLNVPASHLAALQYSSGTSGQPKGVMLTHGNWSALVPPMIEQFGIHSDDVLLHVGPMGHASGGCAYPMLTQGATNVILRGFDPSALIDAIPRYGVTTLMLVPTMIYALLEMIKERGIETSSLRTVIYGGGPMAPERLEQCLEVFGPVFIQVYGQTEHMLISTLPRNDHAVGSPLLASSGRPIPEVDVRVVSHDGDDVPTGDIGEIVVNGDCSMAGYWNRPDETAAAIDSDGWLHTTDMGRVDAHGYLHVVDRKFDMIVSGGYNVYPAEVEHALISHPCVVEAAVVAVPDDYWGESTTAVVRLGPGLEASDHELQDWCRQRLAGYKVPKSVVFVTEELPKNAAGKLLRRAVRNSYWTGRSRQVG